MFIKLLFVLLLGISMSSHAESQGGFKSVADAIQKNQSSADEKQQPQLKPLPSGKQQSPTVVQQDSAENQKPSIIEYCRKHTC